MPSSGNSVREKRLSATLIPKLSVSLGRCRLFYWVCPRCSKDWVKSRGLEGDPRRRNNFSVALLDIILVGIKLTNVTQAHIRLG